MAASAAEPTEAPNAPPAEPEPTCDERLASLIEARQTLLAEHQGCHFSVDCRIATDVNGCAPTCPLPVSVKDADTVADSLPGLFNSHCPDIVETCEPEAPTCDGDTIAICRSDRCITAEPNAELDEAEIPPENTANLQVPPPRPPAGDAEERAQRLLDAIVQDDPSLASDFFFPKEAFRKVKAIPNPDRYWQRLYDHYAQDIHTLHAAFDGVEPGTVNFERLEIVRRGGFMLRGEEGNALPYWAARHNWLHFTREGRPDKIEVRVLITWGTRWYITHLNEFH